MTEGESTLWANLCELFRFCVEMHSMRMRTFCLRHPLLSSLLACLRCSSRHVVLGKFFLRILKLFFTHFHPSFSLLLSSSTFLTYFLAAIRFYRSVINRKDDFYVRNIILYHVFDVIVDLLKKNEGTYNLLHSAILDLFEFIRKVRLLKEREWEKSVCVRESLLY